MRSKETVLSEVFATLSELENLGTISDESKLYTHLCSKLETLVWLCNDDEIPEEYWERIEQFVAI